MAARLLPASALVWLVPLVQSLYWTCGMAAFYTDYFYDRCNHSLADKVHSEIPDPKQLGNLTNCLLSNNTYETNYCIAAACLIVVGAFFCFFGSRFFKVILFFIGLIVVGGLAFFLLYNHLPCRTPEFSWVVIGTSAGVGLLAGLATVRFYTIGIFLIGAAAGSLLMLSILSLLHSAYIETHQWLPIVLVIALAIIFGIVALKLEERFVAIPCTAFIGAVIFMYGLDYYVENAAAVQYTWLLIEGKAPHLKCAQTWVMLTAVWPLMMLAGLLVQCFKTGKKKDDKDEDDEEDERVKRRWRRKGSKAERATLMKSYD